MSGFIWCIFKGDRVVRLHIELGDARFLHKTRKPSPPRGAKLRLFERITAFIPLARENPYPKSNRQGNKPIMFAVPVQVFSTG